LSRFMSQSQVVIECSSVKKKMLGFLGRCLVEAQAGISRSSTLLMILFHFQDFPIPVIHLAALTSQ
jgi:hypothetical protein